MAGRSARAHGYNITEYQLFEFSYSTHFQTEFSRAMKKLKLRGKDLQRIGLQDNRAASLAKTVMQKHYKGHNKAEALEILKQVKQNPKKFKNHPQLGKISEVLLEHSGEKQPQGTNKTKKADTSNNLAASNGVKAQKTPPMEAGGRPARIKPSLGVAKSYVIFGGEGIEQGALRQMETAMQLPVALYGALMPDAHQGYGLPIGGVVATENQVIPYGVGMDIGCRMCMSIFDIQPEKIDQDRQGWIQLLESNTRFGRAEFSGPQDHPVLERKELKEIAFLRSLAQKAHDQLGTSGHGNHFVDIGVFELKAYLPEHDLHPGRYLGVLSHSGSRGAGAEIARHYTHIAMDKCQLPKGAKPLAWLELSWEAGIEYWMAMNWAGDYSAANHHLIHEGIARALGLQPVARIENHHNFAWRETLPTGEEAIVHRKGATPAHQGILGIIPGSMASAAFIVRGKGSEESLNSAAHGAGRLMSRSQAKKQFKVKELEDLLQSRGVTLLGGGLEEPPQAYKDINEVMRLQQDIVEPLAVFKPKIVRMA